MSDHEATGPRGRCGGSTMLPGGGPPQVAGGRPRMGSSWIASVPRPRVL